MPIDYSKYPDNWKEIRAEVLERDNHCCKWCGVENYSLGYRNLAGVFVTDVEMREYFDRYESIGDSDGWWDINFGEENLPKQIKIILTIAHLGTPLYPGATPNKHDKMDCRLNNLAALCQRCHLLYDMDDHKEHRRKNRLLKIEQAIKNTGQLDMFSVILDNPNTTNSETVLQSE